MNILLLNDMTTTRALTIFARTESSFISGAKSIMIESLKKQMSNGLAHFVYTKKDGTTREAWGTTNPQLVKKYVNGNGVSREYYATTAYFDIEKSAWRSFRWENIIRVF